jgi:hypothetical protein
MVSMSHTIDRLAPFTKAELINVQSLDTARWASAKAHTRPDAPGFDGMSDYRAAAFFAEHFPYSPSRDLIAKALTNPGTVAEPAWAAPLAALQPSFSGFLAYGRPTSLPGQLLTAGARGVPFNISMPVQTGGGTYGWVGENAPAPAGNLQLATATLPVYKSAGIIVVDKELALLAAPGTDAALRDELSNGTNYFVGQQMLDPTSAPIGGTSPGGLLYNVAGFGSAGTSSANAATDFKKGAALLFAANPIATRPTVIMSQGVASAIGFALNVPSIATGTSLFGLSVIVNAAAGARMIFLDAAQVLIADADGLDISVSQQGVVEMNTVPTSPVTAASVLVSLWQSSLVGYRITRFISWKLARATAAVYVTVAYV